MAFVRDVDRVEIGVDAADDALEEGDRQFAGWGQRAGEVQFAPGDSVRVSGPSFRASRPRLGRRCPLLPRRLHAGHRPSRKCRHVRGMVRQIVDPGRHLPGLPGRALNGVVEELHHAAAQKLLRPPQILADVVGAGARKASEDAEEDAAEGDLVPVVQQMGLALALLQTGIEILVGLAVAHRLEPGEVVDAAGSGVELSGWDAEDAGHLLDAVKNAVAEPHHAHVGEPGLGLAQLGERVGVVEKPRVRAVRLHRPRHVDAGPHVCGARGRGRRGRRSRRRSGGSRRCAECGSPGPSRNSGPVRWPSRPRRLPGARRRGGW